MDYKEEYQKWISSNIFDDNTKEELKNLTDEEIKDRFYKELSFGTGGLRGVIGAGTNRMNIYTVGKASQGLADYINEKEKKGSVVIAYDSRKMSKEFALRSALIFCANGIKAYLFDTLMPTPILSFSVRELKATAGVVITASHNPPEYNGYKVYWSDGGQIVPPCDKEIIERVNAVNDFGKIKLIDEKEAVNSGLLIYIGDEILNKYVNSVKDLIYSKEEIKKEGKNLKIVYTPLNGTGNVPVRRILNEIGFTNVYVVSEQEKPDGNFPTLKYPNPEDPNAFNLALELAKKVDADLVLATDPDADRLGIYVKGKEGYVSFTGNMSGLLILEYELTVKSEKGLLPKNREDGAIVTTIVSSKMARDIAKAYGLTEIETLTGFKYIGEQIKLFEDALKNNGGKLSSKDYAYQYLFGYEESYGSLCETFARDKDAVSATTKLCEAAAYYKSKGLTLEDQMQNIYRKYGYYMEDLVSVTLNGEEGGKKIQQIMNFLRSNPVKAMGGDKTLYVSDVEKGERINLISGLTEMCKLPKSNVLFYELESNGWFCVRPSGTEPKIKFYFGVKGQTEKEVKEKFKNYKSDLEKLVKSQTEK